MRATSGGAGAIGGAAPGSGRVGRAAAARRGGGFSLGPGAPTAAAEGATPTAGVAETPALLALQAAAMPPDASAAEAMAQAEVMLDALGALQRGLLESPAGPDAEALGRLAAPPVARAADPALAEIQDAVALRAAIELARRGWPPGGREG